MASTAAWEAIAATAARAYGGATPSGRGAAALVQLFRLRGGHLPLVAPKKLGTSAGVGLVASRPIKEGEVLLTVPRALWHPHSAEAALEGARISAPAFASSMERLDDALSQGGTGSSVAPLAALACQIMFQAAPSPDVAYLQWLAEAHPPNSIAASFPAMWSAERLSELDGCSTEKSLGRLPALATTIHGAIFGRDGGGPPVELLLWALCLVQSRATSGKGAALSSGSTTESVMPFTLVPYFDLLNHCPRGGNAAKSFDESSQCYHVTASANRLDSPPPSTRTGLIHFDSVLTN